MANETSIPTTTELRGYLREAQLVGRRARPATATKPARPAVPGLIPFSPATLWRKVGRGEFPKPVKLSERVTAWPAEAVREWLQSRSAA